MTAPGEPRTCEDCGKPFLLPMDPREANPLIRSKCPDCLNKEQW